MVTVELETVAIVLLLIGAFLIAYKVLKMLMETALVSFISAVFYASLAVIMDYPLNLDRVLSFAFTGATLYMVYSVAASTFKGISKVFGYATSLLGGIIDAVMPETSKQDRRIRKLEKKIEKFGDKLKDRKTSKGNESDDKEEPDSVKEVILDNNEED